MTKKSIITIEFNVFTPLDADVINKINSENIDTFYKYLWFLKNSNLPLNIEAASRAFHYTYDEIIEVLETLKELSVFKEITKI